MALSPQGIAPAAGIDFNGPFATPVPAIELRAASTATTTSVAALTTTFTAPATCNDDLLTMLTAKSYQIWINEPLPLPGLKVDDCYPSQWAAGYTSVVGSSSSIAPMMSPLVCPSGWATQSDDTWTSGYIACCASYVNPKSQISPFPFPFPFSKAWILALCTKSRSQTVASLSHHPQAQSTATVQHTVEPATATSPSDKWAPSPCTTRPRCP